jgi:hypothetical protein
MSIDKFNRRMIEIEAGNRDAFKGRRIFSYFDLDPDRGTEKYIINIDPDEQLPQNIRDEIKKAFKQFLEK